MGPEKVDRIKSLIKLQEYDEVYCYGDSKGDKEMLALANFSFYKRFQ
jgi:phosphoserine phosphatase